MRLSTLLSFSLLLFPFALSKATETSTALTTVHTTAVSTITTTATGITPLKKGGDDCSDDPTRNHNTCQCKAGFVDPGNKTKYCKCGDTKDSELEIRNNTATCVCPGKDQYYNTDNKKCECVSECETSYTKHGKLQCKRHTTSSSHHSSSTSSSHTATPSGYIKRSEQITLNQALRKRDDFPGTVEDVLRCKAGEKACKTGAMWHCTDVLSSLSHCGGCPGEAIDCGSLAGVSEVRCEHGRCVIDTCRRGYVHAVSTDFDAPSNTTCISEHGEHWLVQQAAQGRMRRNVNEG